MGALGRPRHGSGDGIAALPPPRATRRKLPLGRGGRLVANGRSHLVGIGDVSATGAYLITRASLCVGDEHVLHVLLPPAIREIALRVRVIRLAQNGDENQHHPRGVAVQFVEVSDEARARLEAFVSAGGASRA
jgi:Tfp pilus assembly protein PilZ